MHLLKQKTSYNLTNFFAIFLLKAHWHWKKSSYKNIAFVYKIVPQTLCSITSLLSDVLLYHGDTHFILGLFKPNE